MRGEERPNIEWRKSSLGRDARVWARLDRAGLRARLTRRDALLGPNTPRSRRNQLFDRSSRVHRGFPSPFTRTTHERKPVTQRSTRSAPPETERRLVRLFP